MLKQVSYCDRCKKECATYYTVYIYGWTLNSKDGRQSLEAAAQNVETNFCKAFGTENHFCGDCINEFKRFMREDVKSK